MTEIKTSKDNFVWIDLEMSGLDPDKEVIIEIATIVTDCNLNILEEGPDLVIHQPEIYLTRMDDWNKNQHSKSGLIDDVRQSMISLDEAEMQTLDFIKKYCEAKQNPLCGNAVHHDRRFLIKYMPKIHEFLHYRHVDVSTIKTVVSKWYPKQKEVKKNTTHRALSDIRESIEELKLYREHYFKTVEESAASLSSSSNSQGAKHV